jgi:hypothetical protein
MTSPHVKMEEGTLKKKKKKKKFPKKKKKKYNPWGRLNEKNWKL